MGKKKPPGKTERDVKSSFSRQFDSAMIETRLIDALVQADG